MRALVVVLVICAAVAVGWYLDNREFVRAYQQAKLKTVTDGQHDNQRELKINLGVLGIDDDAVDQHTLEYWAKLAHEAQLDAQDVD